VGYGVEIFFAFLEGLIKSFTKNAPSSMHASSDRKA
jgi:hypothetical protein